MELQVRQNSTVEGMRAYRRGESRTPYHPVRDEYSHRMWKDGYRSAENLTQMAERRKRREAAQTAVTNQATT